MKAALEFQHKKAFCVLKCNQGTQPKFHKKESWFGMTLLIIWIQFNYMNQMALDDERAPRYGNSYLNPLVKQHKFSGGGPQI